MNKDILWKNNKGAILKPREYHNKIYHDIKISKLSKNKNYILYLYMLSESIYKNTNIIYIDNKPANINSISKFIKASTRKTKEFIKEMEEKNIIKNINIYIDNENNNVFVFNPVYINSCKYIGLELYLAFKEDLDKILPKWIIEKYKIWVQLKI